MSRTITIVLVLVGLAGLGILEWRARRPDHPVPALAELCQPLLDYRIGRLPVGRIAVLGFWWWVGWHFFAR